MSLFNKIITSSVVVGLPLAALMYQPAEYCGGEVSTNHQSLISNLTEETKIRLRQERSVFEKDYCKISEANLRKALNRLDHPKPDHPGEAKAFRYLQQLSEDKQLNAENWTAAREQANAMRSIQAYGAGIDPTVWEEIGPGNIGGRIRSFAFDPDDSNRIYAGAVTGGVWLSEDDGASWNPTDDFMGNLSVTTLIFDPTDSDTIYAGTGEGTFNADYVRGLGIFKSTDKGVSWTALDNTQNRFDFYWVNRLTMLNDGSRILAATHTGIWASTNGGNSWTEQYDGRSNDVDVDPSDDNKLIAGLWGGALYSEDGGLTWQSASGLDSIGNGRVEVAYAESDPSIVYASIDSSSGELFQSTDGGQSYSLVNTGNSYLGSQGWYDNALWVDPTNPDHVIVGGIDLWRSTDAGVTLSKISTWWQAPNSAHADHHFIKAHPDYNGVDNLTVYFANDGGMYKAPDVTVAQDSTGWQELNNTLSITQFYGMGVSPDGTVVGGTQDNGTLIYKGDSEGWTATFGGDGGFSASDPTDSNYIYGEYVYLRIHRSTNGGIGSSYIYDTAMTNDGPNFIAPFILDPNNENRILGGARQLWVSDNVKDPTPSWASKKDANSGNSPISAIAVMPGNSDVVFVGHNNGEIYKTTDATAATPTWEQVDTPTMPGRYVMRLAIDPVNTDIVYVSYGGYSFANLWKSTDGGTTWSDSTGSGATQLPPAPIRTIAIHQTRNQHIYIGTEVGIFTSEDAGATWDIENDGPANVSVDELVWGSEDILYAATHGRGIFRANVRADVPNSIVFDTQNDVPFSTEVVTDVKTITGIRVDVDVSIVNGEYSIGCDGNFTSGVTQVSAGATICLRHTSGADYWTQTITEVTIGASTFNFESRTIPDITPDAFSFDEFVDVDLDSIQTSAPITVSGISFQADVSVNGGSYSVGCSENAYTSSPGVVFNGDTLCLRHTASDQHWQTVITSVTVGDTSESFESTTLPDTTPDTVNFDAPVNVEIDTAQTSDPITVAGIQVAIPISVTNGSYSIGCSESGFTSVAGMVNPQETVCVRHTASDQYLTANSTTLDLNGVTASYTTTTSADWTPDAFNFNAVSGVEQTTQLVSNTVTISGLGEPVSITVSGGEYSIGCGATFTSAPGMIDNGDTVCVRHTSSSSYSSAIVTQLTVGRLSSSFSSTTIPQPPSSSSGGGSMAWISLLALVFAARRRIKT